MQHDAILDQTMFWTGAMFAFTPVIVAGIVLGVWWWGKKQAERQSPGKDTPAKPPV